MFSPRIVILGAGPGGLALARLLHLANIPVKLIELRPRPTAAEVEWPSGMLDLHEGTGLDAIRACGLEKEFIAAMGDCSEATRVRTPQGELVYSDEGEGSNRPEIPRSSLIDLLVRSLPESAITWNTKVASVRVEQAASSGASEVIISHDDGQQETRADLVIGADGAWSKTRKLLTSLTPVYTGSTYITATARHITKNYPHLLDTIGSGASFALGNGHGIMTHRGPQDSMRVYIAVKTGDDERWGETVGIKGQSASKAKDMLLGDAELFKGWAPELKELIAVACDEDAKDGFNTEVDIRPIYSLPRSQLWPAQTGVTILGDAAHLMAPNGEGVNSALADALDLATLLSSSSTSSSSDLSFANAAEWQQSIAPRLREYEGKMHERAEKSYEDTDELLEIMYGGNDGAHKLAEMFKSFGPPDEEEAKEEVQEVVERSK